MMLPLIAGCSWLIAANMIAMFPSKDHHWTNAYILMQVGVPLIGWIAWTNGGLVALLFLLGAMSVLRWPVFFLARWVKGVFR